MGIKAGIRIAESSARTATETFTVDNNNLGNGKFTVVITAGASGSDTVTIAIDGYDTTGRAWYNILTSSSLTANATTTYTIGSITPSAANVSAEDFLPKKFRVVVVKNNATSITYSIGANLSN